MKLRKSSLCITHNQWYSYRCRSLLQKVRMRKRRVWSVWFKGSLELKNQNLPNNSVVANNRTDTGIEVFTWASVFVCSSRSRRSGYVFILFARWNAIWNTPGIASAKILSHVSAVRTVYLDDATFYYRVWYSKQVLRSYIKRSIVRIYVKV